ncbi:uncharacterized protein FIBRA_02163 [Fibroporia radiculosa]|uniref:RTA1 domain protein n=1 Tax=Fibroporia radiculosa TaxID=599839 RepID=J4I8W8_9APHY|nr:uncharacterized protein FIBRA_02163 [Fibroporia radiculosa]CCM00136.1 predicted protein [Fibroporia radiculosa]
MPSEADVKNENSKYDIVSPYGYTPDAWLGVLFIDVISLVVQALGGAEATSSVAQNAKTGSNIMLAGIIFQTIAITIYVLFASEFMFRYIYDRPIRGRVSSPTPYGLDKNMKTMLFALAFSSLCIYLRSWYRMIELADGWNGYIIHTQRYFVIMDALMVTLAMFIMNICHPGRLLGPAKEWKNIVPSNPLDKMEASRVSAESWSQVADDKGMLTNTSAPTS